MKYLFVFLMLISARGFSQSRQDSSALLEEMGKIFALQFTESERDSMLEGIKERTGIYQELHLLPMPNQQPFPFAFNPAPPGFPIPDKQDKINWNIPNNISLPANLEELAFYSITDLASLIKNKKISSVELTSFFLTRLKKFNDTLHCVISFTDSIAMQQAAIADSEIRRGKYRGPLHGIPYGIKDLFSVKGTTTSWGSTPYKDQMLDEDAFVYKKLQEAGAVLCAKLSLGALAYNDLWFGGRTNNPWNLNQGSSGSSAGSASAVSAGLLPFAIGTETWGSIVSPSHRCGVTGLRPSFGSVSRSGGMVLSWSLDKVGPICRSAKDAAIVFYYIKGTDGKDHSAIGRSFNYPVKTALADLRIAYAANYFKELPSDAQQWSVIETLRKQGAVIKEIQFPDSSIYGSKLMDIVISSESAAAFDELTRSNRDELIERQDKNFWPNIFRTARMIPAVEYINANRHRYPIMEKINNLMKDYDVIIVPTFSGNQSAITNLTGHPAIVFPIGFSPSGNPNSITMIGNLYDEASILTVAGYFQQASDHHKKQPPFFSVNK